MKNTGWLTLFLAAILCISSTDRAVGATVSFGSGANTFSMEFVPIGNPGNAADTTGNPNPAGSVANEFHMGKYEVSEDMIIKANAEGGLFLTKDTRGANKPATNITWNEAARFVNWLNTTGGFPKAYKFALNPGDAGYTSNTQANQNIVVWAPADPGYNANNLYRNSLAKYFLPSVDEWYKAAYYDPTSGVYYDYATGSDTAPAFVDNGTAPGTAVYNRPFNGLAPADITDAGGLSPYGTMAQNGNVFEWNESDVIAPNGPVGDARYYRGGYWSSTTTHLQSTSFFSQVATGSENIRGFRVATLVPEPSAAMLISIASLGLLWRRTTR
jgi:formylglycine-generating enzyme